MATPEGWRTCSLAEAVDVNPRRELARGMVAPYVEMAAVAEDSPHIRTLQNRVFDGGGARFSDEDVLLARITPCAENGKTALVRGLGRVGFGSTELIVLGPKAGHSLPDFIYYVVKESRTRDLLISRMTGTSGRQRIPSSALNEAKVLLPPLPEQRKIAAILSAVDEVIEKIEAVIESLQALKKALMQELLTRGLPGRHTRFKQTEIGEVPEGWEVLELGSLCSRIVVGIVVKPASYYVPSGVPALRGKNVREDRLELDDVVYISPGANELLSKSKLRAGDVLTVRTGEPGTSCVVPPELAGANCIDVILSTPGPRLLPAFMSRYLNSATGRALVAVGKGGLAQQHFNVGAMKAMPICLPSLPEQRAIMAVFETSDTRLKNERAAWAAARALKTALMSVLLCGELRVTPEQGAA